MRKFVDLTGKKFGRLIVVREDGYNKHMNRKWLCQCECGNYCSLTTSTLNSGHTQSCGCLHKDLLRERLTTHGGTHDKLYNTWWDMKRRCEKSYDKNYDIYGGQGIKVCDEWHDYGVFRKWALEHGYDETAPFGECTIDRINVLGNYEPSNCRWISMEEQRYNCRNTLHVEYNGEKYTLLQLSTMCGIPAGILRGRIRNNWTVERSMNTPYVPKSNATV